MFEALPIVLDRFVPDTDAIFDANLDPARIGEQVAEAADNAREDLFREGTPGERMLRALVTQAYTAALRNKDFVLRLQVRMQQEVLDRQDQQTAKLDAILATLHADKSVPLPTLRRILEGFGERDVMLDLAVIEARLTAKAEEYPALRERLDGLSHDDPRVQALRREAGALIDAGDFAVADAKLSEAEQIDLAAVEEIEALARKRRLSAAESRAARGDAARLQLDYRGAAVHYVEAAALTSPVDGQTVWRYRLRAAGALADLGAEFGDNGALLEVIAAYRAVLGLAPRERVPLDWAMTQNNLGNALSRLGERESGTARLEEAVKAYRAALEESTRERVPLQWAMTQNNLGLALWALGERESGTARLEEAVKACRAALEEWTRERVPLDWARTQNNLGNALSRLGERESGTARLEEAVKACRAALEEWTREWVPLDWARTKNNLGNALSRSHDMLWVAIDPTSK